MKQPEGLISVLLDTAATEAERDDAAMDLSEFDSHEAEAALAKVGADPVAPEIVRVSCGESLGTLWNRRGAINQELLALLRPDAKNEAETVFKAASS